MMQVIHNSPDQVRIFVLLLDKQEEWRFGNILENSSDSASMNKSWLLTKSIIKLGSTRAYRKVTSPPPSTPSRKYRP